MRSLIVALCLAAATSARAGNITYSFNLSGPGTSSSMDPRTGVTTRYTGIEQESGTITTDGTLGMLSSSNVVSWNGLSMSSTGSEIVYANLSNVSATATTLSLLAPSSSFGFDARYFSGSNLLQENSFDATAVPTGIEFGGHAWYHGYSPGYTSDAIAAFPAGTPLVLATAAPEPSTLILAALGGLALLAWRRPRSGARP